MGTFYAFLEDENVELFAVEAGGLGIEGHHAQAIAKGKVGIFQGSRQFLLQDANRNVQEAYSLAAGLDYPGVGPEHAYYKKIGRAEYFTVNDQEALAGFELLSKTEGIIPALESSHAIAYLKKMPKSKVKDAVVVVCLSGRGDKDLGIVTHTL